MASAFDFIPGIFSEWNTIRISDVWTLQLAVVSSVVAEFAQKLGMVSLNRCACG